VENWQLTIYKNYLNHFRERDEDEMGKKNNAKKEKCTIKET
jgi:hypothetical protein